MILVISVLVDLYESSRPVPIPDAEIEPAATTFDVSVMVSSKSSPGVVDAEPIRASGVVTNIRLSRSSSTRVNTASVDRPGIAAAAIVTTSPTW